MSSLNLAKQLIMRLNDCGYTAYIAGGWVRDLLMNHPSDDIDIATDAPVEEIQAIFEKTIPVGINFGILIVVIDNHPFEVATFRKDVGSLDGRRPTSVAKATPQEDAKRRDFTINGLFYDPIKKELFDFVEGQKDLKAGIIRAIGNPHERFLEDRLRMIRAVRYSARFHFPIETETMQAIYAHANQLFPAVAYERIFQELEKMNRFPHFEMALATLHRLNLLPQIFPSLSHLPVEEIQSRLRHLPHYPINAPVTSKILALFSTSSLIDKQLILETFRCSKKEQVFLNLLHEVETLIQESLELTPFNWAKLYHNEDFDLALEIVLSSYENRSEILNIHKKRKAELKEVIERLRSNRPLITSKDLLKEGIMPGKKMGELLRIAEQIAANESIIDPNLLMQRLKSSPNWPNISPD
ncbi:MAG: CCA tRNA nucleotidyltransferase [Simkaniaceae bacterium]